MTTRRVAELEYRAPNAETVKRRLDELGAAGERANNRLARGADAARRQTSLATRAQDGFAGSMRRTAQSVAVLDGPLGGIAGRFSALSTLTGGAGIALGGIAIAATAAAAGIGKAVGAARQFEQSTFKIDQLLVTTGNASGRTARQIEDIAQSIGRATLASTDGVRQAAAQLLTFRSISGETFDETLRLAQDLAAIGFGSIESAATQLAKALDDPEQGLTSLRRVGVSFTESQRDMILAMREAGDVAGAQAAILAALRDQVGGAGVGEASGLSGAIDTLGENMGILAEKMGEAIIKGTGLTGIVAGLAAMAGRANDRLFGGSIDRQIVAATRERVELEDKLVELRARGEDRTLFGRETTSLREMEDRIAALKAEEQALIATAKAEVDARQAAEESAKRQQESIAADIDASRRKAEAEAAAKASAREAAAAGKAAAREAAAAAKKLADEQERHARKIAETVAGLETENVQLARLAEAYGEGEEAVARVNDTMAVQNTLIATGVSIKSEDGKAIAELVVKNRELKESVDDLKEAEKEKERVAEKARADAARAAEKAAEDQRRTVERATERVSEYLGDTFADVFSETGKSWKDLWNDMQSFALRTIARIAAEAIVVQIQPQIASRVGGGGSAGLTGSGGAGVPGGGGSGAFNLGSLLGGPSLSPGLDAFAQGSLGFGQISNFAGQAPGAIGPFQAPGLLGGGNALAGFSSASNLLGIGGAILPGLLSGNFVQAGFGGAGAALGTLIAPGIGTALGGFLGNLLGGLFKGSASGSMGLETLPTPTSPDVNPFAGRGVSAHRRSPFGVVGFQSGADQLKGQADEVVDAAGAMDKAIARILSDGQIAQVSSFLQANPPPISTASTFKEADFRGQILGRGLDILEGLGAGPLRDFEALGLSAKDEGSVAKIGDLVEELVATLNFLESATDDYTEAARRQVGAVVDQADAVRESVEKFKLSAEQAAQAEARIREESLKLLGPPEAELSATEQALKSLSATFDELRANAGKLGLTLADIDPAQDRALSDLAAGFNDATRRAILAVTDPLELALEDFDQGAAQRLEDAKLIGANINAVEERNAIERAAIIERFAEKATESLDDTLSQSLATGAVDGIGKLLDRLRFGDLSPLSSEQRFAAAETEFETLTAAALDDDFGAIQKLPAAGELLAELARSRFGSTATAAATIEDITRAVQQVAARPASEFESLARSYAAETQDQTRVLVDSLDEVRREVAELRRALRVDGLAPARVRS